MSRNMPIHPQSLRPIHCFEALTADDLKSIASRCAGRRYTAGETVVQRTDENCDVYFIIAGRARVTHFSHGGKETEFRLLRAGDSFGEISAIDGHPRSADVVAIEELTVARLAREQFLETMKRHAHVAEYELHHLTQLVRTLSERIVEVSTLRVNGRIRAEILRMAQSEGVGGQSVIIESPPTHAEIAARISTHREAVSRELGRLRNLGLMNFSRKLWRIADIDALRELHATQSDGHA